VAELPQVTGSPASTSPSALRTVAVIVDEAPSTSVSCVTERSTHPSGNWTAAIT
jgi:hypothetical protein